MIIEQKDSAQVKVLLQRGLHGHCSHGVNYILYMREPKREREGENKQNQNGIGYIYILRQRDRGREI